MDILPESRWSRPPVPPINPQLDLIIFQQIDIDSYISNPVRGKGEEKKQINYLTILNNAHVMNIIIGMPGSQLPSVPILKMFGITSNGNSVCAHVHGFMPYLYVPSPFQATPTTCKAFQESLAAAIVSDSRSSREATSNPVLAIDVVSKSSLYGYQFNESSTFLRVILSLPKFVAPAKRLLEIGLDVKGVGNYSFQVFESNIEYEIRFMIDADVVGCNWIEVPPGKYSLRKPSPASSNDAVTPTSRCQIELDVSYEDFISHTPEEEWQKIAPLRILSFDIECAGRKGVFPEADIDPVIQIANMIQIQGEASPCIRNVFTLGSCSSIVGSDVRSFANERDLLQVSK